MSSIDILNRTVNKSWRLWSEDQSDIAPIFEWIISSNGGTAIHDNVLLLGFKEEELEPTLVAKICRSQKYSWTLDSEYHRLVELWKCMGDEAIERLPKPIALENKENNHIFITNYLKGTNITDLYNSNLNGNILKLKQFMVDAAKSLRFLNKMTATTINSGETLQCDFHEKIKLFSSLFPLNKIDTEIITDLGEIVNAKSLKSRKKVLVHGDYWHGNMIRGENHGNLMIIDWQFARWSSDVSIDVYMFLLAAALSCVPYGHEKERAKNAAKLLSKWKHQIIPHYLESYGSPEDYVLLNEQEGMLICCIEMATRPMFNFNCRHHDDLMWYTLFGELINLD